MATATASAPRVVRPRGRLGTRLALILLPLVLVPLVLMGGAAYLRTRAILEAQARSELTAITKAQLEAVREWARRREAQMQLGVQRPDLAPSLNQAVTAGAALAPQTQLALRQGLAGLIKPGDETLFSEMALVRASDGEILASTSADLEGKVLSAVPAGQVPTDRLATTAVYNDSLLAPGNVAVLTSLPLAPSGSAVPSVLLLGVNRGLRLGGLMESIQRLWQIQGEYRVERGEQYLAVLPNVRLLLPRYSVDPVAEAGSDRPIFSLAPAIVSGSYAMTEPDSKQNVIGGYQWADEIGLGVALEVPASDVFAQLGSLAPFTVGLIVFAAMVCLVIVLIATDRLLRPLGQLTEFADRISRGEWGQHVPEGGDDEIGALAASFNRMADDLSGLYGSLEARVAERTQQVRTAAEVARAVTSTPNLDDLLRRAVELIRDRFGYYHVTIFLLDDEGARAVVRESTGEVGQLLKARGHSLPVGSPSIIGWVTANNQGRIATDVARDPIHLKNELLPETRSEAAVPLQVSGRVFGALDVQSKESNAFSAEALEVLQALADQLSTAIQNAQLAQDSAVAAERARLLSDVTSQFGGLMDVERVLETAANTLHRVLGQPEITIMLGPEVGPAVGGGDGELWAAAQGGRE
ncbi:MAG TPA: GAF domain-containing protein [Anaerolineales bacterium]|nr:GAF domain-containing protein [Anaerolineales bacterium]